MDLHPLSAAFPRMDTAAFELLKDDIRANGLRQPVVTIGGQVLDGGHRYRACQELGIDPPLVEYTGTDPIGFVISANLHRRHLNESQRAMIGASIETMRHGGDRKSQDQDANLHLDVGRAEAAKKLRVSTRSIAAAAKVRDEGAPELQEAVKSGAVSVSAAAAITSLPKQEQALVVKHGQVIQAAKKVRNQHKEPQPGSDIDDGQTDAERASDLAMDLEHEMSENRQLQARIESLTKADLPKEIDRLNLRVQQLNIHLESVQRTRHEAEQQAGYYARLLGSIREALGVSSNTEILGAIRKSGRAF